MTTRQIRCAAALVVAFLATVAAPADSAAQDAGAEIRPSEVHVVATLYQRHAHVPAYDHDTLRAIIERVAPDVVVLDVSPGELRRQSVHASKAEYPSVIFPLVRAHGYRAYAGEPDEPLFSEIVSRLSGSLAAFRTRRPSRATADQAYADATFEALKQLWQSPAAVNGPVTDQILAARRALQDALAGPEVAAAWSRWNSHLVEVVRRAARENPGRRILVLVGVENAALLRPALRALPEVRLMDTFAARASSAAPIRSR